MMTSSDDLRMFQRHQKHHNHQKWIKKHKQSFEQKFHRTKFARSMLKNDDVIKNGYGLSKKNVLANMLPN